MFFVAFLSLMTSLIVSVVLLARRKFKAGGVAFGIFAGLVGLLFEISEKGCLSCLF
jgi:hypothetical protein